MSWYINHGWDRGSWSQNTLSLKRGKRTSVDSISSPVVSVLTDRSSLFLEQTFQESSPGFLRHDDTLGSRNRRSTNQRELSVSSSHLQPSHGGTITSQRRSSWRWSNGILHSLNHLDSIGVEDPETGTIVRVSSQHLSLIQDEEETETTIQEKRDERAEDGGADKNDQIEVLEAPIPSVTVTVAPDNDDVSDESHKLHHDPHIVTSPRTSQKSDRRHSYLHIYGAPLPGYVLSTGTLVREIAKQTKHPKLYILSDPLKGPIQFPPTNGDGESKGHLGHMTLMSLPLGLKSRFDDTAKRKWVYLMVFVTFILLVLTGILVGFFCWPRTGNVTLQSLADSSETIFANGDNYNRAISTNGTFTMEWSFVANVSIESKSYVDYVFDRVDISLALMDKNGAVLLYPDESLTIQGTSTGIWIPKFGSQTISIPLRSSFSSRKKTLSINSTGIISYLGKQCSPSRFNLTTSSLPLDFQFLSTVTKFSTRATFTGRVAVPCTKSFMTLLNILPF